MIKLRKLKEKYTRYMLECMHDSEVKTIFQNNFFSINNESVLNFVRYFYGDINHYFAIVYDSNKEYLGTISLKNIEPKKCNAEFAISTIKCKRGTGVNSIAVKLILKHVLDDLKSQKVYRNMLSTKKRFYEKNNFIYEGAFKEYLYINGEYIALNGMVL